MGRMRTSYDSALLGFVRKQFNGKIYAKARQLFNQSASDGAFFVVDYLLSFSRVEFHAEKRTEYLAYAGIKEEVIHAVPCYRVVAFHGSYRYEVQVEIAKDDWKTVEILDSSAEAIANADNRAAVS